jgi:hypothetical protein
MMNAEQLEKFLNCWVALQQRRSRGTPWTHVIEVPRAFEAQVRVMCHHRSMTHSNDAVEIRGERYRTRDWRGWMAFQGYALVLTSERFFRMVPRSAETIRLVQGG